MMATAIRDTARFEPGDPQVLVAASFACPVCLHSGRRIVVSEGPSLPVARCRCTDCGQEWTVALGAAQTLRLALDAPDELELLWEQRPHDLDELWRSTDGAPDA